MQEVGVTVTPMNYDSVLLISGMPVKVENVPVSTPEVDIKALSTDILNNMLRQLGYSPILSPRLSRSCNYNETPPLTERRLLSVRRLAPISWVRVAVIPSEQPAPTESFR